MEGPTRQEHKFYFWKWNDKNLPLTLKSYNLLESFTVYKFQLMKIPMAEKQSSNLYYGFFPKEVFYPFQSIHNIHEKADQFFLISFAVTHPKVSHIQAAIVRPPDRTRLLKIPV
jgi:hypothetical protein